jgi:SAM-dependent methyltransferase
MLAAAFDFACPLCQGPLEAPAPDERCCPADGSSYRRIDGIWHFLTSERAQYFRQFIREYSTVRRAEGRGASEPHFYRALPYEDRTGNFAADWRIRARSFDSLLKSVLAPLEAQRTAPLRLLDLGAGNGWLSYRLAQRGHAVAAIDLLTDPFDGLGVYQHYDARFTPVQADFDHLPFSADQADLAIFNASFHYATDYPTTLKEVLRVLRSSGQVVIMDSPVYRDGSSGARMVKERERRFRGTYGFASDALPSESYLTYDRLSQLGEALGLVWRFIRPFYGWRWALRPLKARILGHREPARFLLVVGKRET